MNPHIQVRDLNVFYGKNQTLKNINLDIPRNQITVIMFTARHTWKTASRGSCIGILKIPLFKLLPIFN